jgi:hypothetical protein
LQVLELVVRYILTPHIYYIIFSLHAIHFPVLGTEVFIQYSVLVTVAVWDRDITNVAYNGCQVSWPPWSVVYLPGELFCSSSCHYTTIYFL